jgi:hypothetical protein
MSDTLLDVRAFSSGSKNEFQQPASTGRRARQIMLEGAKCDFGISRCIGWICVEGLLILEFNIQFQSIDNSI